MLFLNTLQAEAGSGSNTYTGSFDFNYDGSNAASSSSTTIIRMSNGCLHFEIPVLVKFSDSITYNANTWYDLYLQFGSFTPSISQYAHASISNVYLKYQDELAMPVTDQYSYRIVKQGKDLQYANNQWVAPCYICFDLSGYSNTVDTNWRCNWSATILYAFNVSGYQGDGTVSVSDSLTHQAISDTNNKLDTQIQQETDAQTTRTGILNKITDFFGSFFTNLIGVFVPESGYFENWFSRVNTLLEDKLGILYFPFGYLIDFLGDIYDYLSDSSYRTHCYIDFPPIQFTNAATGETYTFYQGTTIDLNSFNVNISGNSYVQSVSSYFNSITQSIRIFNSVVIIFALFNLCYRKLKLILEGHEDDN